MYQTRAHLQEFGFHFQNLKTRFFDVVSPPLVGVWTILAQSNFAAASEASETIPVDAIIVTSTPLAIAFMLSILALKITAFVLGYLIVRLGHDTLIKGVTGEIDFGFSGSGFKTKLKAASPGALFVLMGAAIIIWGLAVKKPMEIKTLPPAGPPPVEAPANSVGTLHRPKVPD